MPISRSRAEIEKLLREWGADGIQWSDSFQDGHVTLRFTWKGYVARFDMTLEDVSGLRTQRERDHHGKREHRVLVLWLKAALNAVDMGIVSPEALFLPFLEDKHGRTVAEQVVPKLAQLTAGSALKLLPAGSP